MTSKRGDDVLVRFTNSDLITYKKRPSLIVQADALATGLPQRIVAAITSNTTRTSSTRVLIHAISEVGHEMGLLTDSIVMADNLVTILDRDIARVIGRCSDTRSIDQALRLTLGL